MFTWNNDLPPRAFTRPLSDILNCMSFFWRQSWQLAVQTFCIVLNIWRPPASVSPQFSHTHTHHTMCFRFKRACVNMLIIYASYTFFKLLTILPISFHMSALKLNSVLPCEVMFALRSLILSPNWKSNVHAPKMLRQSSWLDLL